MLTASDSLQRAYLQRAALDIASRLVRDAIWHGEVCAWQRSAVAVESNGVGQARRPVLNYTGSTIYEGTAGIALFLAECYRIAPSADLARVIEGAALHALAAATQFPPTAVGFYSGRVGVAYAAAAVGRTLQDDAFIDGAQIILDDISPTDFGAYPLDAMDGVAGAVPALLCLAGWTGDARWANLASKFGELIIARARMEPAGWSWPTGDVAIRRNLIGFARGASGFGHALSQLFDATGDGRFRYAAGQAFAYEAQFFDANVYNWRDQRRPNVAELAYNRYAEREAELARAVSHSEIQVPDDAPRYRTSWCYGAGGIALARLAASRALGADARPQDSHWGAAACRAALNRWQNISLCHGLAGDLDCLISAAVAWGDALLQAAACAAAAAAVHGSAPRPWPCGTDDGGHHPGLMTGEAGIGYVMLRLLNPATPSVLAVTSPTRERPQYSATAVCNAEAGLRRRHREQFFDRSLRNITQLLQGAPLDGRAQALLAAALHGSPTAAYNALCALIVAGGGGPSRALLEDACVLDKSRFELQQEVDDFTTDYFHRLATSHGAPRDASDVLAIRTQSRLIREIWNWDQWTSSDASVRPTTPERGGRTILLARRDTYIAVVAPSARAARVYDCLASSARSIADLITAFRSGRDAMPEPDVFAAIGELWDCGALMKLPKRVVDPV